MAKILIIDDEEVIREGLLTLIELIGYQCIEAENGRNGLAKYKSEEPDLILLDLKLPDISGRDILTEIRKTDSITPIIVISGLDINVEMSEVMDMGADDFLSKPWTDVNLHSKIKYFLNHRRNEKNAFRIGNFSIDYDSRKIKINNNEIHFSTLQFNILELLTKNAGKAIKHEKIIDYSWTDLDRGCLETLHSEIQRIRQKIKDAGGNPEIIETSYGFGYLFNDKI
ncbi:MAG: operon transcriptional regulatory protein KdpE [Ignavibacteria bacterium]|nr:operon transcriptional regulatory protein KdpE [Ignavibacteria bacterium]